MRPLYLFLSLMAFAAMIVLALALLGGKINPLPAAFIGTTLFAALMAASGRIEEPA